MKPMSFLILAGVTVVAVLLAILSSRVSDVGDAIADRGAPFIAGLFDRANDVAKITVDQGDETFTFTRTDDGFADASGYPIKPEVARAIISNLALMKIEARKTADPDRHGDLELASPEADNGAGERITLFDASDRVVADVIVGDRNYTVGGTGGGQFVRRADADQTFLVRGAVSTPATRQGLFDTVLRTSGLDDVTRVGLSDGDAERFRITRDGEQLTLDTVPEGRTPDTEKLDRVAGVFAPITFTDVRKSAADAQPAGPKLTAETKSGLTISMHAVAARPTDDAATDDADDTGDVDGDTQRWVRMTFAANTDDANAEAETLATKTSGFEFKLDTMSAETFGWSVADVTTEPES